MVLIDVEMDGGGGHAMAVEHRHRRRTFRPPVNFTYSFLDAPFPLVLFPLSQRS